MIGNARFRNLPPNFETLAKNVQFLARLLFQIFPLDILVRRNFPEYRRLFRRLLEQNFYPAYFPEIKLNCELNLRKVFIYFAPKFPYFLFDEDDFVLTLLEYMVDIIIICDDKSSACGAVLPALESSVNIRCDG